MPDEAAGEEPGQADEVPWGVSVLDAFTVFPEAFSSHPSCPLLLLGAQDCGTFLIVLRFLFMHVSSGTSCFGGDLLSKSALWRGQGRPAIWVLLGHQQGSAQRKASASMISACHSASGTCPVSPERRAASWGAGADHLVSGGLYGRRRLD